MVVHSLTGIIYGYAREKRWVYIGQTMRPIAIRDNEHRTKNTTTFDRAYSSCDGPITPLESRLFRCEGPDPNESEARCRTQCQKWMDERERALIARHGTYVSPDGYNMTPGGHSGHDYAMFYAKIKQRNHRWAQEYMPLFHAAPEAVEKRLWAIPQDREVIGTLLSSMRTGHTTVPPDHLAELNAMGYNGGMSFMESRWDLEYMPLFRVAPETGRKRLWAIPRNREVLGTLLTRMRTSRTIVPPEHLAELNAMGYNDGRSFYQSRWDMEYMPLFRAASETIITPGDRKVIGRLLSRIRADYTQVPLVHLNELNTLGFINDDHSRKRQVFVTEKRIKKKKHCVR